jgi:hypothetical protein
MMLNIHQTFCNFSFFLIFEHKSKYKYYEYEKKINYKSIAHHYATID